VRDRFNALAMYVLPCPCPALQLLLLACCGTKSTNVRLTDVSCVSLFELRAEICDRSSSCASILTGGRSETKTEALLSRNIASCSHHARLDLHCACVKMNSSEESNAIKVALNIMFPEWRNTTVPLSNFPDIRGCVHRPSRLTFGGTVGYNLSATLEEGCKRVG
jgi:hypothetical protein